MAVIAITRRGVPLHTPDGINVHIFALSDELVSSGHDVYVLSDVFSDIDLIKKFFSPQNLPSLICLTDRKSLSKYQTLVVWLSKGQRILREILPDLIIVNGAVPFSKDLADRSCFVSHDLEKRKIIGSDFLRILYKRKVYLRASSIVATCSELRDSLSEELSVDKDKIKVIPTCFDTRKYHYYRFEERENAILHIGTVFYKNPKLTIQAFSNLENLLEHLDLKLYITGNVTEELLNFVNNLKDYIKNRIVFLGLVDENNFKKLLAQVKIVSVPSTYTTPVASPTAIEALLSGTPVVASYGISKDVIIDGINGFMCPLSPEEFAEKFKRIMSDKNLWERMSSNALTISRDRFGAHNIAKKYLEVVKC